MKVLVAISDPEREDDLAVAGQRGGRLEEAGLALGVADREIGRAHV